MAKYPYRKAGTTWDRVFRNNYNQNMADIESDIRETNTVIDQHKKLKPPTHQIKLRTAAG